jgi:chromosomal replication initiator protein
MVRDINTVWDKCLHTIRKNVNSQSFKTWFEPIKPIQLVDQSLTIQVPNKFFYEWLEEHYVALLKKTIRDELGSSGKLEYQIRMNKSEKTNGTPNASKDQNQTNTNNVGEVNSTNIENPFIIPGIKKLEIDPQLNKNYRFTNYIEGIAIVWHDLRVWLSLRSQVRQLLIH